MLRVIVLRFFALILGIELAKNCWAGTLVPAPATGTFPQRRTRNGTGRYLRYANAADGNVNN